MLRALDISIKRKHGYVGYLVVHQETNCYDMSGCKFLAGNATARDIVDLLLVITIIELSGTAVPIIQFVVSLH